MRFDVYDIGRDCTLPEYQPVRTLAVLADAGLRQTAEFLAARVAGRSAEDVRATLQRFAGTDDIHGPGPTPWPDDRLVFVTGDGGALGVYAVDDSRCRFCRRSHRRAPADLCPPARDEYDRSTRSAEGPERLARPDTGVGER